MPQIRPYTQQLAPDASIPAQQAQASDFGGPGVAMLGKAVQSVGQDMAYVEHFRQQHEIQREVGEAHLKLATIANEHTQKWAAFSNAADLNDPNLYHTFTTGGQRSDEDAPREGSLKWALQDGESQFQTEQARQTWRQGAASLSQHFLDKAVHLQVHNAGVAAKQNSRSYIDQGQNRLRTDPSAYPDVVQQADKYVNGLTGIDASSRLAIATMMKEQFAESAVQGVISYSPEEAIDKLDDGTFAKMGLTGEAADRSYRRASRAIQSRKDLDKLEVDKRDVAARAAQQMMYRKATLLDKDGKRAYSTQSVINEAFDNPDLGDKLKETISTLELKRQHEQGSVSVVFNETRYTRELLPNIYKGKFGSELEVLKAGADYLDPAHANQAISHFHDYESNATAPIKQDFRFGEDLIKGTFRLPPGAAIDAAGVLNAGNRALDRFNTWYSSIVDEATLKGPTVWRGVDIQAKAREFRDHEYSSLYENVIRILPEQRSSLKYKTHEELAKAREKGDVSAKEWSLYSRQIDSIEQMEVIASQKPQKTPKVGGRVGAD